MAKNKMMQGLGKDIQDPEQRKTLLERQRGFRC